MKKFALKNKEGIVSSLGEDENLMNYLALSWKENYDIMWKKVKHKKHKK